MRPLAIWTKGLTKNFGDVAAVRDLDLEVSRGEVFGFLGPNGAGKSTTIRLLLDQIRPSAGGAEILGLNSHFDSLQIRRSIGPGDLTLYPKLTGAQTLRYFAGLRGGVDQLPALGERHRHRPVAVGFADELAERLRADLTIQKYEIVDIAD